MSRFRPAAATILGVLAISALAACSSGLDEDDTLEAPFIVAGPAQSTCAAASGASVSLDLTRTVATTGFNGTVTTPVNNVRVFGTANIAPGDAVRIVVVPRSGTCTVLHEAVATVDAGGELNAVVDITTDRDFRVVALVGPAGSTADCAPTGCLDLQDAMGAPVPLGAVSNTIDVVLQ